MVMMTFMEPPSFAGRAADLVELFAGVGRISRLARCRGWFTMTHDCAYDEFAAEHDLHNCMDLCGNAGFLQLVLIPKQCRMKCSCM